MQGETRYNSLGQGDAESGVEVRDNFTYLCTYPG